MSKPYYQIDLTQGQSVYVDEEDFRSLNKYKWRAQRAGKTFYAVREVRRDKKRFSEYMHRRIMSFPTDKEVDHIDGDGLNNRRSNLRVVTKSENGFNQHKHRNNADSLGTRHIGYGKRKKRYTAQIAFNGRQINLGYFLTQQEAHRAYMRVYESLQSSTKRVDYERDHSHFHCWQQGKSPACGLKTGHKVCCLCAIPVPKNHEGK